jgi:hypothetical protein
MYTVGKQAVPLHVLCGEWWEILLDGVRYCLIVGNRQKAEQVVKQLNGG